MINRSPAKNTACHRARKGTLSAHYWLGRIRGLKTRNSQKTKTEQNVVTQSHLSKLLTFLWCSWWAATISSFSCKLINQEAVAPGQGWVSSRRLHMKEQQSSLAAQAEGRCSLKKQASIWTGLTELPLASQPLWNWESRMTTPKTKAVTQT